MGVPFALLAKGFTGLVTISAPIALGVVYKDKIFRTEKLSESNGSSGGETKPGSSVQADGAQQNQDKASEGTNPKGSGVSGQESTQPQAATGGEKEGQTTTDTPNQDGANSTQQVKDQASGTTGGTPNASGTEQNPSSGSPQTGSSSDSGQQTK